MFLPFMVWSSFSYCIFSGMFIPFVNEIGHNEKYSEVLSWGFLVLATFGLGSCFGGTILSLFLNKLKDQPKKKRIVISCYHALLTLISFSIFLYLNSMKSGLLTTNRKIQLLFLGFCWGLMDSAINNEISIVLSKEFKDSLGAFGVFKLVQSSCNFLFLCFLIPYV